MTNLRTSIFVGALALGLGLAACDDSSNNDNNTTNEKNPATAGNEDGGRVSPEDGGNTAADSGGNTGATVDLSDPEIGGVTTAANTGEIAQANAALPKLSNADIKAFAQEMATAHGAAQTRQANLLAAKGITPQDSSASLALKAESDAIVAQLNAASAATADSLYIDSQVTVHTKVLEALDMVLIPSADDAQLKQELVATRADVNMHLTHARQLRDALTNK